MQRATTATLSARAIAMASAATMRTSWSASALAALLAAALATLLALPLAAFARDAPPEAADPALEARMVRITSELRCLVCQNQTIADSNADLAADLRRETRELLRAGKSDAEVVDYMTARYGDFVLYRPPLKATTALLWFGPALLLVAGGAVLVIVLRRRSRMAADAFDPDVDDEDGGGTGRDDGRVDHAISANAGDDNVETVTRDSAETAARDAAATVGAPGRG